MSNQPKPDQKPSPQTKPDTSSVSEMLTNSEIERLVGAQNEALAYMQKVYPGLKIE